MRRLTGFTMVEMTIVLVMIGILTAALAPMLLRQHTGSMEERDRVALLDMKTAIISYATTFGGIPDPVASEVPANVAALGVNRWGAFGDTNVFRLDVNDALKSSATLDDRVVFCQSVVQQISSVAAASAVSGPKSCLDTTVNPGCTTIASAVPVAFVVYSTGNDREPNQANAGAANTASDRFYENDKRGINNTPGADQYDDQVMSYPLTSLARDCREKMNVAQEVMRCAPGEKYLGSVTNNYTASTSGGAYGLVTPPASAVPANFTLYDNGCHARTLTLYVNPNVLIAASAVTVGTLDAIDINKDGRVDVFIDSLGVATAR